jgi:hypothetical protein
MKANELRIGNYICNEDYIVIVESIDKDGCIVNLISDNVQAFTNNKGIEPIPLTEEWLLKFGFVNNELSAQPNVYVFHNGSIYVRGMSGAVHPRDIQYVHQLQNLYFALTNEELTMK